MAKPIPPDSEPVVGRFYEVPGAVTGFSRREMWLPLLGAAHRDPELRVPVLHYHYDLRFLSGSDMEWIGAQSLREAAGTVLHAENDGFFPCHVVLGLETRRRKCLRTMPDFPHTHRDHFIQFRAAYLDRSVSGCNTCPHRGFPLGNLPIDSEGCVICPGHGLRIHLESERVVRREA